jgi:hypothetical protein
MDPMLAKHEKLMTNAYVTKLEILINGRRIVVVHVERNGEREIYPAKSEVVACGSLSSASLMSRSDNGMHPVITDAKVFSSNEAMNSTIAIDDIGRVVDSIRGQP